MKKNKPKYSQILDAAVIVIAENGYYQAQVSKIAKQAGVADGTIYLYFKNKEDILVSLFEEKMGEFVEIIKKRTAGIESAAEKLFMLVESHLSLLAENHHLAVVTQLELRQSNKEIRWRINEVLKRYLRVIDEIVALGVEKGEFQSGLNVRIVRQMIFGTLDEVVTNWVMSERKYDLVSLTPTVHELLANACGCRK